MISENEVQFYRDNGYLVVENVLSADEIALLRADTEALVAQAASVTSNNEMYDLEDTHSREHPRVRRIKTPHRFMPSAGQIARNPKLVSILTRLIGPNVRLDTSKLNMKSAEFGAAVEWHQDWAFYPHTNDDLLAVGVMMDTMSDNNGPLQVIPGSHKGPICDHHTDGYFCGAIDPEHGELDFSKAVSLTGPAGSMTFHHVRTVHGSALNRSDHTRRLLLYQYTAVDAWPLVQTVDDINAYNEMIVAGEATLEPRMEAVPVRLPLPPAPNQGSIYENQRILKHRFFERYEEAAEVMTS